MNECSNGTATNCSNLKELETIWNMTQCGRKILSEGSSTAKGVDSGASDGIRVSSEDNVLTGNDNEGSSVSGSGVLSRNNAEEESSDESSSESKTTASLSNAVGQNSAGSRIGRKKRQVFGSNSATGSFGFSSGGSFGSSRSQPAAVDAEYEFLAIYMSLPEIERMAIGHDFEGMFKSCIFEGVDCLDPR